MYKEFIVIIALFFVCHDVKSKSTTNTVNLYYDNQTEVISYTLNGSMYEINSSNYKFSTWFDIDESEKKGVLIKDKYLVFSAVLNNKRDILYIYSIKAEQLYALYNVTEWASDEDLGWAAIITSPVYSQSFEEDPRYILIVNGKRILEGYEEMTKLSCENSGVLRLMLNDKYPLSVEHLSTVNPEDYFPSNNTREAKIIMFGLNQCPKKITNGPVD